MARLQGLQCDVVTDSAGDGQDISSEMTDSALGPEYDEPADQESTDSPNRNESSATASNLESDAIDSRTDSGCFTSPEEGVPSIATTRNGKVHTISLIKNEFKDMSIVGGIEEAKRLSNELHGLMKRQQQEGSSSLTAKVFCKRNFTMAIVGEAGCRLFFPDASLFLEVPKGALAKETVIYVFKPINGEPDEQTGASKVVRCGPRLHCGTEETTFLHPVKLSVKHYAHFDNSSTKFTVRKCENAKSPWNILPTEDSTIRERTVDVMLSSFSIVEFVIDECDIEAAPKKKMACIFGILQSAGGRRVALVYLVDDDVAVVQLIEDHLKAKGCSEEDITILPHVPVDPRTDVTFTVIGSDTEMASVSFKLSLLQHSHLSFDLVSDAAKVGADRINVSQSETILAVCHIWNGPIGNQGLPTWASSPQQADGEFGFTIPTPIPPDERPADTTHICNSLGFEVYDGRIEHQGDNAVSCDIEGEEDETLPVGYVPPLAFNRNRRRSSIAGIPSVPTIREDSGAQAGANIVPLPVHHDELEEPEVLPQQQRGRMTRRATIDAGKISIGSQNSGGGPMNSYAETLRSILTGTGTTGVFAIGLFLPTQRGGTFPKKSPLQFNKRGRKTSCPVTCPY